MNEKKNRLLCFSHCGIDEGIGGAARLNDLMNIFQNLNFFPKLILYGASEKFKIESYERDNLDIKMIYMPYALPTLLKGIFIPIAFFYGIKCIRKSDIVFSLSPSLICGINALFLSKFFNKPLITNLMDSRDPNTPEFIFNLILRNSAMVFAISRYLELEAKDVGCNKVIYLPIFTNPDTFQINSQKRNDLRKKWNLADDGILIGYTGSFWYGEGVSFLIKAFRNISKRHNNVKLLIVGGRNVSSSEDISKIIDKFNLIDSIIHIPQQPHNKIPFFLSACDILCCPKIDCIENRAANPVKVVEYLSMGVPAVCSSVGGIKELIEDGKDGMLVEPGNIDDLEKKLETLIINPNLRKKVGNNARKKVLKNYSYESIQGDVKKLLFFEKRD